MEQGELAKAAGLTQQTVSNFETKKTLPHEGTRSAIQAALEARGIVFTNGDKPGFYFDKTKADIPT
jgi:DNA-binding XRE family transcriptional regulator